MEVDDFQKSVIIAGTKFPVKSYFRAVTDDLVARFGDGAQGQTNLDLTKALTQESFRGGMFQRVFDDPERVSSITGLYYNETDQKLYLADNFTSSVPSGNKGEQVTAWCVHGGKIYYNLYKTYWTGGDTEGNTLWMYDPVTDTTTARTLTTAVSTSTVPVTSLVSHGDHIYIAGKDITGHFTVHRFNPSANTCTSLVTSTVNGRYLASFRDKLYCIGLSGLFLITNETGTATFTAIKSVGNNDPDYVNVHNLLEFNGALWVAKSDGLFRYDGIDVFCVIPDRSSQSQTNYKYSAVFNGAIYFTRRNTLWRFDGVNLEELQDFSSQGSIIGLSSRDDRLCVTVRNSAVSVASDKFGQGISTSSFSVFAYTGVGFYEYKVFSSDNSDYITPMMAVGLDYSVFILPRVYLNASLEPRHDTLAYGVFNHAKEFSDETFSQTSGEIISSEIDCKFPAIPKTLNGVFVETDDFDESVEGLKIYVRVNNGIGYGDWVLVYDKGGFRSTEADTSLFVDDYYLHDGTGLLDTSPLVFKRLQYKVEFTNSVEGSIPRIRSLTLRYTLQPKTRFKWQLTLGLFGRDADGVDPQGLLSATYMRQVLLDAHRNKLPILLYDIDYSTVSSVVNTSLSDFVNDDGNDDYTEQVIVAGYPFIAPSEALAAGTDDVYPWFNALVKDVEYNAGTDQTTYDLYPVVLGHYGRRTSIGGSDELTTSAGKQLRRSHAVYITSIDSERLTMDYDTENSNTTNSDYKSEITLTITEV